MCALTAATAAGIVNGVFYVSGIANLGTVSEAAWIASITDSPVVIAWALSYLCLNTVLTASIIIKIL
jgi:hypothetical protein